MPYRTTPFVNNCFYHIYNRGVEKRDVFMQYRDYERFLDTLYYYQFSGPKPKFSNKSRFKIQDFYHNPKIVEVICYCLMPNHFHILIRQTKEGGIHEFIKKVINSYTKYFNTKHNRVGYLFQGRFKATPIENDEQLLHISRYIHLNPLVADLVKSLDEYDHSSYKAYLNSGEDFLCVKEPILGFFNGDKSYRDFIKDQEEYGRSLYLLQHVIIEDI